MSEAFMPLSCGPWPGVSTRAMWSVRSLAEISFRDSGSFASPTGPQPRFPKMLSCKRKLSKDLANDELRAVSFPESREDEPLACKGLRLSQHVYGHLAIVTDDQADQFGAT